MSTIKVRFDGHVFVPETPVALPVGYEVELEVSPPPLQKSSLVKLAEIANQFPVDPDTPTDLAAQHDHYLYGTPKQP